MIKQNVAMSIKCFTKLLIILSSLDHFSLRFLSYSTSTYFGLTFQERKRKYCDVDQSDWTDESDSEDEGVAVKLEKYCEADDSQNDPDFVVGISSAS